MADIRIFVCCHEMACVPEHPLLVPLQVGAALAGERFTGFAHDDEGENISRQNRSYCELTGYYWAWKNVQADYLGFFHYRRYLYPDLRARLPYRVEREPSEARLGKLGYNGFGQLIEQYDILLPKAEDMHVSVREHYANAPNQRGKDLALMEQIVRARHPQMAAALETYLSGTLHYFGNLFIMRRPVFEDYCAWLFPLLAEFDERVDLQGCDAQERRVDGYLGERLFGIYLTYCREKYRTLELPRVHFYGDGLPYLRRKVLNALLPPGSVRRSRVKMAMTKRTPRG